MLLLSSWNIWIFPVDFQVVEKNQCLQIVYVDSISKKTLFDLSSVLNTAYPDYDFSDVKSVAFALVPYEVIFPYFLEFIFTKNFRTWSASWMPNLRRSWTAMARLRTSCGIRSRQRSIRPSARFTGTCKHSFKNAELLFQIRTCFFKKTSNTTISNQKMNHFCNFALKTFKIAATRTTTHRTRSRRAAWFGR